MKKTIIWLSNDLRISDNLSIENAANRGDEILFLYIFDEKAQDKHKIGLAAKWFLHQALNALNINLKEKYNTSLIIKKGDSLTIIEDLINKYQINSLFFSRDFFAPIIAKQNSIKDHFEKKQIEVKSFNNYLLFDPENIKNLSKSYFKIFTPFWKKCLEELAFISSPVKAPQKINLVKIEPQESLELANLNLLPSKPNWAKSWPNLWPVSEDAAHDLAHNFIQEKLLNYKANRDFPSADNTSILSPYLNFGIISPKQIYFKIIPFLNHEGSSCFLSEIGWREFSHHLLFHFPQLPWQNFKSQFDNFAYENNQELLKKWQKGETGYPLIDAGMRQLWHSGFMHNRVRMVVASFLTKNLLIDWRLGQEWFWDCLIDANIASNSASWQWVAGSGADAAPYFRIFNPITQSEKFDANGDYIRKWVPEIAWLPNSQIHFPSAENRQNYFQPIIDLNSSRNRALELYKKLNS